MATVSSMPGSWSWDAVAAIESVHENYRPVSTTRSINFSKKLLPVPDAATSWTLASSSNSNEEQLFSLKRNSRTRSTNHLAFKSMTANMSDTTDVDWKRYDPPAELLNHPDNTSEEIQGLLQSSIDALQARHLEESRELEAAARASKPLGRSRRVSGRPRAESTLGAGLDQLAYSEEERTSMGSASSVHSNDSGYGSRRDSKGNSTGSSPREDKSFLSGLASKFKHRKESRSPLRRLGEMTSVLTLSKTNTNEGFDAADTSLTNECVSCLDDFPQVKMVKLTCHSYCGDCFQRLIKNAMEAEAQWPVKCCLNPIPYATIRPHLDTKTTQAYQIRLDEWSIPAGDRVYCSSPTCSTFIPSRDHITNKNIATCHKCRQSTCVICRGAAHRNTECQQDPAVIATNRLAELEGWKRCYSCQALVEHNTGCRHMTCRCKAQFCYICSARWRTCECTDAELTVLQTEATRRRMQEASRVARNREFEEEERRNVQLVEEFIARENAAAEAKRTEEEKVRRLEEEARRASLRDQFQDLAVELEDLHVYQRIQIQSRQQYEAKVLDKQFSAQLTSLKSTQSAESAKLDSETSAKLQELETQFMAEYTSRVIEENRAEAELIMELQERSQGQKGMEYTIRKSRGELRREQEDKHQVWDLERRDKTRYLEERVEWWKDDVAKKHKNEKKQLEERWELEKVEVENKVDATQRWVEEVIAERRGRLRDLEAEVLGDAQIRIIGPQSTSRN